ATSTDLPLQWIFEPTEMQPDPRGILEAYMAGPQARRVTAMKEAERISFTLGEMEKVHPGIKENFERGATKCWDEDEWSRGDYCWFRPGQLTALLPDIIRAEDRIHFAGEHASPWPGWMQGALYSVCRARSKAEFISRIGVVVEESDETVFWLEMIVETEIMPKHEVQPHLCEANELLAVFAASQRTAKEAANDSMTK